MNRAIFLDRDGVLNRAFVRDGKPYPPSTLEEFEILPSVPEALRLLRDAGFYLIVVTNQPDVARNIQKKEVVEEMHKHLFRQLPLHDIEICYDVEGPANNFYKPRPGMLLKAAEKYKIELPSSYMIGDRWRDVGAGKAAGCRTIFIENHYAEQLKEVPDFICTNLLEAANFILR